MSTADATLRAGEMKKALLEQIDRFEEDLKLEEVGEVLEVKDGVARIWGLSSAVANEMLEIESSETGELIAALALNLEEDNIGAVVMGDYLQLKEGDSVLVGIFKDVDKVDRQRLEVVPFGLPPASRTS